MDSSRISELKRLFVQLYAQHCEDFVLRPEFKQLFLDVFNWCLYFDGRLNPAKGLWLYGNIGTGKSTMLKAVQRFCRVVRRPEPDRNFYWIPVANAIQVCADFSQEGYTGIDEYIDNKRYAFDELGSETIPSSYYGNRENVFQYILQRRYELPQGLTLVTTNLAVDQIAELYGPRIYDRCKEMFNFVRFEGATFRKQ